MFKDRGASSCHLVLHLPNCLEILLESSVQNVHESIKDFHYSAYNQIFLAFCSECG